MHFQLPINLLFISEQIYVGIALALVNVTAAVVMIIGLAKVLMFLIVYFIYLFFHAMPWRTVLASPVDGVPCHFIQNFCLAFILCTLLLPHAIRSSLTLLYVLCFTDGYSLGIEKKIDGIRM